ncbi:Carboxyl-terminal protease [hydrothermal vent metagenome]|uniref:Carboxyl-terminal protease n=1 Tax=hydrothermal vent metagenome TaxID=652676 RepID=A0A3B0YSZ5_9ZZZZ
MKFRLKYSATLFAGMLIGIGLTVGNGVIAKRTAAVSPTSTTLPLNELRAFTDIYIKIKNTYVTKIDDKKLFEYAIRGMLSGLDPHSSYLDMNDFRELQTSTTGEFGGLGIEVGMENGFIKVITPIDDTPAKRAGVKAGDIIIRLDQSPVKGLTLSNAVKKMRGKPGSDMVLTVIRKGVPKPFKIVITRAVIKVKSVKSKMLDKNFGYIRITQFQAKTGRNVMAAALKLMKSAGGQLKGLVLDLRNNPGGVLGASVTVSDAFLNSGLIVYTKGREKDSKQNFSATEGDVTKGAPIIVLVNGGSASASEIVAGALQDHKRAIIMGEKTFGKGSVQTILPSRNKTAVKLTTARYYTPSGRSIQAKGIKPDIIVEANVKFTRGKGSNVKRLKESNLAGHLKNNKKKQSSVKLKKTAKTKVSLLEKDYQLFEALTLLKGLSIAKQYNSSKKTEVAKKNN